VNIHEYEVGLHKNELDTPALLLDMDVVARNIKKMADHMESRGVKLRPHAKIYKASPIFAWMQIRAGALGLTVSKLSEAEILVNGGIQDILVANQVVGDKKVRRLVNLAAYTNIIVAVDSLANVQNISDAAVKKGSVVSVLVEVNIGNARCGVEPFEKTLVFVKKILGLPGIQFRGLMGYDGHLAFHDNQAERFDLSTASYQKLVETADLLRANDIPVEIVSGGGTNTYKSASSVPGLTEIQCGTYIFSDTTYRDTGLSEFECGLTLLTTVISRPDRPGAEDLAILDIGTKGCSTIYGFPEVKFPEGTVYSMPQEHSRLRMAKPGDWLKVGDHVELRVKDANGTLNLYDQIYCMRGDMVEAVWDIPGRGKIT
jgi:D-serine deaminase-like pyridoxal phosphate-dependent protein